MKIKRLLEQTSWSLAMTFLSSATLLLVEILKIMVVSKEDGDAGHQIIVIKIILQDKVIIPR